MRHRSLTRWRAGSAAAYYGVELCDLAAAEARNRLTEVMVGDIEAISFALARQSTSTRLFLAKCLNI